MATKRAEKPSEEMKYKLEGFDTFEGESYDLPGSFNTKAAAESAALDVLKELERTQPSSLSGGQSVFGIQDRVFIVNPNGTKHRVMPRG